MESLARSRRSPPGHNNMDLVEELKSSPRTRDNSHKPKRNFKFTESKRQSEGTQKDEQIIFNAIISQQLNPDSPISPLQSNCEEVESAAHIHEHKFDVQI